MMAALWILVLVLCGLALYGQAKGTLGKALNELAK